MHRCLILTWTVATLALGHANAGPRSCEMTAALPDIHGGCCGKDASGGGPRIIGGTDTGIDEYPWMALLMLNLESEDVPFCGGVLITGQHVLTAAHCTMPFIPDTVVLGEYDFSNSGPDCILTAGGGEDCTSGEVIVPVEKAIRHPDYNSSLNLWNDIALIKLTRIVEFTDFIRPICLPVEDFTLTSQSNLQLYVAGWGTTTSGQSIMNNIKKKVRLPYVAIQACQKKYKRTLLWNKQICAGGEPGRDSCVGDSGGPLMSFVAGRYELVGTVSFGPKNCGGKRVPSVNTKVYDYLPWIRSQIAGNSSNE